MTRIRRIDVVGLLAVAFVLVALVSWSEQRRHEAAIDQYDAIVESAFDNTRTWLDDHRSFQRAVAFSSPDAASLSASFAPTDVRFAILLDHEGRVVHSFPPRPDIRPGDDLRGRFPHIDAVLDGADEAYWASDAATTPSGSVVAIAVKGSGREPTVLSVAIDLVETGLLDLVGGALAPVHGAAFRILDERTGVEVLSSPGRRLANARTGAVGGWTVEVKAPTHSIDELVGGTADIPGRIGAATILAILALGLVLVRRERAIQADGFGLGDDLAVFETSAMPMALLDPAEGRILRANDALSDLTGRPIEDLVGHGHDRVLVGGHDGVAVLDRLVRGSTSIECRYWHDGEQRSARVSSRSLARPGRQSVLLVEVQDREDEQRRLGVVERQRAMLEDLAGRLSHDLRTPISAMIGFADLLHRMPDAPSRDRAEWAGRLKDNASQLSDYVRDMVEAASSNSSKPLTEVRGCVARALRLHDTSLNEVGAVVDVDVDDGLTVTMPELLLRQVLNNLVDNAVKYRNRALDLHLAIAALPVDGMVVLTVADNGPGIPATERGRVFDSGYRSSSDRIAGTGLGLAMCRTLVEEAGGTLDVVAAGETGARFVLRLPAGAGVTRHPVIDTRSIAADTAEASAAAHTEVGRRAVILDRYRPDEVMIRHSAGAVIHVSPPDGVVARLLGGAKSSGERLHPDDVGPVIEAVQQAVQNPGVSATASGRFRDDDGAWITLDLHMVQPPEDEDVGGMIFSIRPAGVEAEHESLFDRLPFPAMMLGHHRQLVVANDAAREGFGWVELPSHDWMDDLPDDGARHAVRAALDARVPTTWVSEAASMAGVVVPLSNGDGFSDSFLVGAWETVPGREDRSESVALSGDRP